jgi:hypothetical protein
MKIINKTFRFVLKSLAESIVTGYGSALLAYVLSFAVMLFVGDHKWVDWVLISPTFLLPMLAGAIVAYLLRKQLSKTSYFGWIVPSILFLRAALEVMHAPYATDSEVWNTLLGTACGGSECLYEVLFTLPFVSSLAYSLSSICITTLLQEKMRCEKPI